MKKSIFASTLLALFLFACKKDQPANMVEYADYANLKTGNYWLYERYRLDADGTYTPLGIFDSTFVEKDTLINGNTYFKYMEDQLGTQPGYEATFIRDSLHYLVNSAGRILFSSENFVDTFAQHYEVFENGSHSNLDTLFFSYTKMADDSFSAVTPAGTFVTKNVQQVYVMHPPFDTNGKVRSLQKRYAEGVGVVEETLPFYLSASWYHVRRLVRYGPN